jgi:hypothetical protein
MNDFIWDAKTVSELVFKHYDTLSPSDKLTLQKICTRALRKLLSSQLERKN